MQALQGRTGLVDGLLLHAPVGAALGDRLLPRLARLPAVTAVMRRVLAARAARGLVRRRVLDPGVPEPLVARFQAGYAGCAAFDDFWEPAHRAVVGRPRAPRRARAAALGRGATGCSAPTRSTRGAGCCPRGEVEVVGRWGPLADAGGARRLGGPSSGARGA